MCKEVWHCQNEKSPLGSALNGSKKMTFISFSALGRELPQSTQTAFFILARLNEEFPLEYVKCHPTSKMNYVSVEKIEERLNEVV